MKRLLEWKQRMLQSPLTRKSSRNTSRAQTPTNSSSPAPSMSNTGISHGDNIRQKVLVELERHQPNVVKHTSNSYNTSVNSNKSPQQHNANGVNMSNNSYSTSGSNVNIARKVSRKGSGASRSSRSRSSPRVSNRPTTSSSDEGKS